MSRLKKVMKGRKGTFLLLGAAVLLLAGSTFRKKQWQY